jgi:hypothetical protein
MNTKICKKCGRELPATTEFFYRDSRWKELFRSPCKECCAAKVDKEKRAEYMKEFNATHKEYLSEYHHNYNIKNNEKAKAYKKTFKEYFTEWHREYVRRNKEKVMTKQREWEIKNREKRNEFTTPNAERKNKQAVELSLHQTYANNIKINVESVTGVVKRLKINIMSIMLYRSRVVVQIPLIIL